MACAHQLFFSAPWLCLGSFLAGAVDAAPSGAMAVGPAAQGPDLAIGRGVPFSAPWSCLAIGLAQSWDIMAPPMGMEALAAGWIWAEAARATEANRAEAKRERIVFMTMNSKGVDAMGSAERLTIGEARSSESGRPLLATTTGRGVDQER